METTVEQTESTPSSEGVAEQTSATQDSEAVSQETQPNQSGESVKVENSPTSQTSQFDRRPPSSFYKMRQLEKQIKQMNEMLSKITQQSAQNQNPVKPSYDPNEDKIEEQKLLEKPIPYLRELLEKEKAKIRETLLQELREKEFPSFYEKIESQKSYESKARDAWKLIFPNLDFTSNKSLEEIQAKDPARFNAIQEIWDEYGLEYVFQNDPMKAAQKTLEIFDWKKQNSKRTPLAPSKASMGTTAGGTPVGGQKTTNIADLQKKADKLASRFQEDSSLLQDEKFMKEWEQLKEAISKHKDNA